MMKPFRKLVFALVLLTCVAVMNRPRVQASSDNMCDCYGTGAYLYEIGPWYYIDQLNYDFSIYINPGGVGWYECLLVCHSSGQYDANTLCNTYSFPNEHYQFMFAWRFTDNDNDSGGSDNGSFDTGSQILMCQ
jgi:hypothetical protein